MKPKYYYITYSNPYSNSSSSYLELRDNNINITICESEASIDITVGDNVTGEPPEEDKYCQVKPITQETFNSYYTNNLRSLKDNFLSEAEYYLQHNDINWYNYYSYTNNSHLNIEISESVGYFSCRIYFRNGVKGRLFARRHFEVAPEAMMAQFFNLTIELLYDPNNFGLLKDEYLKQLNLLIQNGQPIAGLVLNADIAFNEIRTQIETRITSIENRMINFDDSKANRNELRGELKGLKYCLKVLDSNR